jgi:hypothetical protein
MRYPLTRRELLLGVLGAAAAPPRAELPVGSARCLVEAVFFRQPGPPPKPMPAAPLAAAATIPGRVEPLPETAWQLGAVEAALKRRADYAPLAHALWAAIVPPNGRTTAHLEEVLPAGAPLSGSIALQRGQYLLLGVEVDYAAAEGATYPMRERRRVKFGERHYFDHPAFGLIVQVTPSRGATAID